ncbi:MAG TPA: zf-TFIIB domain-containing protein [Bacteroidia bacterium]|nr:zf-TFIIB domain-containing protein [Sphingobacteriales bacterium]HPD64957.1 zf-TFIIB domain-containing protein [Bacteroidia bacterium]HRS58169.1 zf-TFIIB domain-containing protein [Bacteroidia bacterium]HRU67499.1 zf-TFIIB domain-containing protein [Bacteroidia bacterium]
MKCPFCNDVMVILELNQIETDFCTSCKGIWLDGGELELLLQDEEAIKKLLSSFGEVHPLNEKRLRCPVCRKKMEKTGAGENHSIIIDKCINGHGIWFDSGELNRLADYAASGADNPLSAQLNDVFKFILKQ